MQDNLRAVSETALLLRQTLGAVNTQLTELQGQLSASRSAQAQMVSRIDGVQEWVDEFRSENLSANSVRERLVTLAGDLRSMAARVDSLRARADAVPHLR